MQIGKSEGTWVEVIDWGEFKSFRKLFWIGRYRNTFWTGQFESFTFLGCVQTDATTPNLWCIMGRIQPIGLCKPCVISVRRPNNVGCVCMGLPTLLGPRTLITHGFVSFPRCTAGPNIVGSCCIRLHTTANTHATTPNIIGATMLGVVASVCTQPYILWLKYSVLLSQIQCNCFSVIS